MTFLSSWRDARQPRNSIETPTQPLTFSSLLDWMTGPPTLSGVTVNEHTSLGMPAVWRAVNLIAGTCASLPLHAYRSVDDVRLPQTGGQAHDLLANPHPDLSSFELWELVYTHLALWGNAYLLLLRDRSLRVAEMWPLHPNKVKVGRASDLTKVYEYEGVGYTDREILHIPGFGYDGVRGVSPIQLAKQGIGLALAAEQYGAKLFGSGSLMSGILTTEHELDRTAADRLKASWRERVGSGLLNAHDVAILEQGVKFERLSIPPEDAQFVESRKFQIAEVARMFGVPPHMLMDTEKSTSWGTGIEQQGIGFIVYTLRPWLTRVEQRVTRLLKPSPVYAKYSVEGLLRGDTRARYESYATGRQWGWLSVNEIRRLEDLPPVEGGDSRMQPLNMTPLGTEQTPTDQTQGAPNAAA